MKSESKFLVFDFDLILISTMATIEFKRLEHDVPILMFPYVPTTRYNNLKGTHSILEYDNPLIQLD